VSDLSPAARELLRSARVAFSPDESRIAVVRAMVEAKAGAALLPAPGASSGRAVASAAASTPVSLGIRLLGWGLLAAVAACALLLLASPHRLPSSTPAPSNRSAPTAGVLGAGNGDRSNPGWTPVATGSSMESIPAEALPVSPRSRPALRRHRVHEEPKAAAPVAAAEGTDSNSAPEPEVSPAAKADEQPASDDSLAREIALLRAARAALEAGRADEALSMVRRHAQLWPTGVLVEERLATQVLALCALGRTAEARATAQQLAALAPSSPHLARVGASCAGGPEPAGP
jgi:hypothetical protein